MNAWDRPIPHFCHLSDGVVLAGYLWKASSPVGVVVIRTPYEAAKHGSIGRSWASRGYHCLIQDVRGRYRSGGSWEPYKHETSDGAFLLNQLREEHPGVPLLVFGASYAAHTALEAALGAADRTDPEPDALVLLVPALGLAETAWDSTGRPEIEHRIGWWHEHGRTQRSQRPLPPAEINCRSRQVKDLGPIQAAQGWGWDDRALHQWRRLWNTQRLDTHSHYASISAPLLLISGDRDFFVADARELAGSWSGASHLVTGPWGHRLTADITDPQLLDQLQAQGGLGALIDAWLAAQGLPGAAAQWTRICTDESHTESHLDPDARTWNHQRNLP
ncbi:CocE/NonD family hydrolase [Nesterenkonia sp. AN1]|uniref:CocE/NonD family hydrolase n=1 Tax=Nesterenkonia sp. AN1 TaxID=652017 RepID=UPI00190F63D3